jgi:hypothetical protein
MKTHAALSVIFIFMALFFAACETDDPIVETDERDKFLGLWSVAEDCNRLNYDVNVSYDPGNSAQVLISNFANPGPGYDPVVALVADDNIIVPEQQVGENWTVSGDGTYQNGTVNWNYTLKIGGNLLTCSAVYSK